MKDCLVIVFLWEAFWLPSLVSLIFQLTNLRIRVGEKSTVRPEILGQVFEIDRSIIGTD